MPFHRRDLTSLGQPCCTGKVSQVNVLEAKTQLSALLARVEAGEEIVIARAGVPVAKLVPIPPERKPRVPGLLKGKYTFPTDEEWAESDRYVLELFEESPALGLDSGT